MTRVPAERPHTPGLVTDEPTAWKSSAGAVLNPAALVQRRRCMPARRILSAWRRKLRAPLSVLGTCRLSTGWVRLVFAVALQPDERCG